MSYTLYNKVYKVPNQLTRGHETKAAERRFGRTLWRGGGDTEASSAGGGHVLVVAAPRRSAGTALHPVADASLSASPKTAMECEKNQINIAHRWQSPCFL